MFQDEDYHRRLIEPALKAKDRLKGYYKQYGRVLLDESKFKYAHYRYVLRYDELSKDVKLSNDPVSMRIMEYDENGPIAIHELSIDWKNPLVLCSYLSPKIFEDLEEVVKRITLNEKVGPAGELRHLSVPELNVEAQWYRQSDGSWNDLYYKLYGSDEFLVRSENDFITYLNELKAHYLEMESKFEDSEKKQSKQNRQSKRGG